MGVSCTRTVRFERNLKGVAVVDVEYAKSSSNTVAPTTGWATTAPSWEQGKFIWERTRTEYTDATVKYSTPVCITGSTGNTGTGISSIVEEYYRSSSATALVCGSWLTKYPGWAANYYIWTRSHITYTDGGESYTTPICVTGSPGQTGPQGDKGPALRGPQSWNDCATNYTFQAGGKGEDWKDVVIYNGNYYSCAKSHSKEADNYPTSTKDNNNHYWQLADKIELVAANILLATYALIKNLGVEALDMRDDNGNILIQCKDGNVICNTGTFQNIVVKGSSTFEGQLKAVTGSFRSLNCVDANGNVICTISLTDSGFTFGNGDMYHQGTKDGRSLRFYTSNLYCRGLFGARQRSVLIVLGTYGYYFPNGIPSTATASNYTNYGVYVSFTGKTSSANVNYYILPLYAEVSGASGLPVDEVWFRISSNTTYTYELQMAVSQRTRLININNSYNNARFFDNDNIRTLNGGETVEVTKIHNLLMLPAKANTVLGGGIICGAFKDNDW